MNAFHCGSLRLIITGTVLAMSPATVSARLGETAVQCANRYGPPKDSSSSNILDKNSPLLEGAIHHTYEYQGWKIRAAFLQLDGPAVRMDYSKLGGDVLIKDYELQAIITGNMSSATSWKQVPYSNNPDSPNKWAAKFVESYFAGATGEKMWRRSDGAILWLRSNLIVRLELPAAREYETKLKADKEQKARASVPQF